MILHDRKKINSRKRNILYDGRNFAAGRNIYA